MSTPPRLLRWLHTLGMPENVRLRGLVRLALALLLFPVGVLLVLAAEQLGWRTGALPVAPLLAGLALLPWGVHELLLGRNWSDGRPMIRLLLIVTVLPVTILPLLDHLLSQ